MDGPESHHIKRSSQGPERHILHVSLLSRSQMLSFVYVYLCMDMGHETRMGTMPRDQKHQIQGERDLRTLRKERGTE